MIKGQSGQTVGAQMVNASTGAAFASTVTVYVTLDGGVQAIGSVGSGLCTAEGNGYYTYTPSAAETSGDLLAFTFIGSGAVPATVQIATITPAQVAALQASTGPGVTVADLIANALKRINVIQSGENPSADDQADAFLRLNQLMGKWRLRRLTIPYTLRSTWTISSSKGTLASPYTVGSGGDIAIARPPQPNQIVVRYQDTSVTPTLELPLTPLTDAAWRAVPQKNLTSALPTNYYYNPTYASGLGSLYLWMVPTQSSLQGVIYAPAGVANFSAVSDTVTLPDGYDAFIQDALAVDLWTMFRDGSIDPELVRAARDSEDAIKTANFRMADLSLDPAVTTHGGHYDIQSDSY